MRLVQIVFHAECWLAIPFVRELCPKIAVAVLAVIVDRGLLCRFIASMASSNSDRPLNQ